ncbi:hypothetical protein KUH32_12470 [Thalassococcus sp. CAU 1522]|uniref:DUF1127 domain-containing protein n=1 Tax=Thalassococcus arenae TaxID=2851652 RepID=A0ABS6N9A2_9RHOB|nr:hypothetical protein [Thalassococcus arenae]MBV2360593.1 hypothetical protein [Thalassococcus arenae]
MSAKALQDLDHARKRPRRRSRAWAALSRAFRARHDRRRIEQLRRDPHLARDVGLTPRPDPAPIRTEGPSW